MMAKRGVVDLPRITRMRWTEKHTQGSKRPKIDLTNLKGMTEEDWKEIIDTVPFMDNGCRRRDYRDGANIHMTNFIFKPNTFRTATESGLSMLRTLNFS